MKAVNPTDTAIARGRWKSCLQRRRIRHFPELCVAAACAVVLMPLTLGAADDDSSPIFGIRTPTGSRQWKLIAPSHETGSFNELRGILGNPIAMYAYWDDTLPSPDGAVLAKLEHPHAEISETERPGYFAMLESALEELLIERRLIAPGEIRD